MFSLLIHIISSLQLQQQSAARMPVIKPGYTTINKYHEMKQTTLDRSTCSNLVDFVENVLESVDANNKQEDTGCTDISKAFYNMTPPNLRSKPKLCWVLDKNFCGKNH